MRGLWLCAGLVACLCLTGICLAGGDDLPVPPPREHDMGEVPLEEGEAVTAEQVGEPVENEADAVEQAGDDSADLSDDPASVEAEDAASSVPESEADPAASGEAQPAPAEVTKIDEAEVIEARSVAQLATESRAEIPQAPVVEPETVPTETEIATPADEPEPVDIEITDVDVVAPEAEAVETPRELSVSAKLNEVELAERVAVAREAYRVALEALKQHYVRTHNATKLQWAEKELTDLAQVEKYHYLSELELAGSDLQPPASISAADRLYREGMEFKNYPAFPPEKKEKLKTALQKFRQIITDYPTSDKIDDAAFRMGEIYEGWYFEDFRRAAVAFERAFQWDPATPHPARFKAAKLYDEKLMERDKAVELYNRVVMESQNTQHVQQAIERLKALSPQR